MYIERGGVKLSVISKTGREAVVAMLGPSEFFGEGCLAGQAVRIGERDRHHAVNHPGDCETPDGRGFSTNRADSRIDSSPTCCPGTPASSRI